jgi:hypothetical protein
MSNDTIVQEEKKHPSRNLTVRKRGYGIGGGYERPYRGKERARTDARKDSYGAISHGGYYGGGSSGRRFAVGQAGFGDELDWYQAQYGEETSGYPPKR